MKRLPFIILLMATLCYSQPKTFYMGTDTIVTINNKAVLDYYKRMMPFIKSPTAVVLSGQLVFRRGLPVQLIDGYPVQFTNKGVEVKPKVLSATLINFRTKVILVGNLADNDGDFGKPVNPKPIGTVVAEELLPDGP